MTAGFVVVLTLAGTYSITILAASFVMCFGDTKRLAATKDVLLVVIAHEALLLGLVVGHYFK